MGNGVQCACLNIAAVAILHACLLGLRQTHKEDVYISKGP